MAELNWVNMLWSRESVTAGRGLGLVKFFEINFMDRGVRFLYLNMYERTPEFTKSESSYVHIRKALCKEFKAKMVHTLKL